MLYLKPQAIVIDLLRSSDNIISLILLFASLNIKSAQGRISSFKSSQYSFSSPLQIAFARSITGRYFSGRRLITQSAAAGLERIAPVATVLQMRANVNKTLRTSLSRSDIKLGKASFKAVITSL